MRGGAGLTLTVYGAKNDLHSGNYGNWAPDPSMRLARLLASMKDDTGRVIIEGFYRRCHAADADRARGARRDAERRSGAEEGLPRGAAGTGEERLERKLNEPTLSILAMESGGGLSAPARSAIPASAAARIEMRLVHGLDPAKQNALVVDHIRKQGYFVVEGPRSNRTRNG